MKVWQALVYFLIVWVGMAYTTQFVVRGEIALVKSAWRWIRTPSPEGKVPVISWDKKTTMWSPSDGTVYTYATSTLTHTSLIADGSLTISGINTIGDSYTDTLSISATEFHHGDVYIYDLKKNPKKCPPHMIYMRSDGTLASCGDEPKEKKTTSGEGNRYIGRQAGVATTGDSNVTIGGWASYNTCIGKDCPF